MDTSTGFYSDLESASDDADDGILEAEAAALSFTEAHTGGNQYFD
jgi:hypothetical protein